MSKRKPTRTDPRKSGAEPPAEEPRVPTPGEAYKPPHAPVYPDPPPKQGG